MVAAGASATECAASSATKALFRQTELKLQATHLAIRKIEAHSAAGTIEFDKETRVDPVALVQLISEQPAKYSLDKEQRLRFTGNMESEDDRFAAVAEVISLLSKSAD